MMCVLAAERLMGARRLRRARRYLTAAAGDEKVTEPGSFDKADEADGDAASASATDSESGADGAGGSAPEHDEEAGGSAPEEEADWGSDEDLPASAGSAAASASASVPSASALALVPSSETRFWAACREALAKACGTNAARMAGATADLNMQRGSMESGRLDWRTLRTPSPGEPKVALASHALNRDYQVKVALPLQCLSLLRMRNVGA